MALFLLTHRCNPLCARLGLDHPVLSQNAHRGARVRDGFHGVLDLEMGFRREE